jgi:hypothetical protein
MAAWRPALLATILLVAGCGDGAAPECDTDAGAAQISKDGAGDGGRRALPAADAGARSPLSITLDRADKGAWVIEAIHGRIDEPFALSAGSSPEGKRARVAVSAEPAIFAEDAVPLAVEGLRDGAVDLGPGETVALRLVGTRRLSREGTYKAWLWIDAEARPLVITSRSLHPPLGLRSRELVRTWDDIPPFGTRAHAAVIFVDAAAASLQPYHVVVEPSVPSPGADHLPSCGITVQGTGEPDRIAVRFPPLGAGRYEGVLMIQGEPLAVRITLKNPFWIVLGVVAFGSLFSLFVRWALAQATAYAQGANRIEAARKRIGSLAVTWDDLSVKNALRQAEGSLTERGLDDLDALLKDAELRGAPRPQITDIEDVLEISTLPAAIRDDLRGELKLAMRWCSRVDQPRVGRRLTDIHAILVGGGAAGWVADIRRNADYTRAQLERIHFAGLGSRPDGATAERRIKAALDLFATLLEDAVVLLDDDPEYFAKSPAHAEQIARIRRALHAFPDWVTLSEGPREELLLAVLHCNEWTAAPGPPADLSVRVRPWKDAEAPKVLRAHEEITFEIVRSGDREWASEDQEITWRVDGEPVASPGGPRLTYVFPTWSARAAWPPWGPRKVVVTASIGSVPIARGELQLCRAESDALRRRGRAEWMKRLAAVTAVGVAAGAAVAIYWAGKPFGSWPDYMALVTTALGVDVSLGAGGKLLDGIIERIKKKLTDPRPS